MTDIIPTGAMAMVKIDGAEIKRLREEQGLTQLYLATAVQVTTDTISRWENKRYPSIKKENGLKLAEALGVELDDLLETGVAQPDTLPNHPSNTGHIGSYNIRKSWPLLIFSATVAAILGAFAFYFINQVPPVAFIAKRTLPSHFISKQRFPVIITVTGAPENSTALILKETLPENATVLLTVPEVSAAGVRNKKIKWLKKIEREAVFSYVVRIEETTKNKMSFHGSVAINRDSSNSSDHNSSNSLPIGGYTNISSGMHHWADKNGDNMISDSEILTVYDHYSSIEGLEFDIDLIEEIWLGSGYSWDPRTSTFEISE